MSLSGFFDAIAHALGIDVVLIERTTGAWVASVPGLVPFILETVAFTLLYCLIALIVAAGMRSVEKRSILPGMIAVEAR